MKIPQKKSLTTTTDKTFTVRAATIAQAVFDDSCVAITLK